MTVKQKPTYLFQVKDILPAMTMLAATSIAETAWQMYWLFNNKLVPVDQYWPRRDSSNSIIFECLGEGELVGRQFPDGKISDELKRFLKKSENEEYRSWFENKQ